ncbi:M15 family metallopeptidase [Microcoleus sp. C2C3]|uniref:M15 family metallopeptidase n=1 Tax=unclassified Microcoleus TaxID=2642155 RepID=UPI002FD53637
MWDGRPARPKRTGVPPIPQTCGSYLILIPYRSISVQQILYNLAQEQPGFKVAAQPGRSNHQNGLAIDIEEPEKWQPFLESEGWQSLGPSDPVHFDFVGSGTDDISSLPILAFQQLWNLNHPEDKIPEDGQYTPETEERLNQSPREGFPKGGRAVN